MSDQSSLDKYNAQMSRYDVTGDYRSLETLAQQTFCLHQDFVQFMNRAIDCALELCGHSFYRGSAIRLAMWLSPYPALQVRAERWLKVFQS